MCSNVMHVLVAGGRDVDVGAAERVFDRGHLEAFHCGLKRIDRIDLGDDHARAKAFQRMRRALADIAVAADDSDFSGDHQIGRALDAVGQRFAATVEIVELGLRHRIVDVDRRHQQLAFFLHLVEAVHAGRGFLGYAAPVFGDLLPESRTLLLRALQEILDHLLFVIRRRGVDPVVAVFHLRALVDQERDVAAVIDDELGTFVARMRRPHRACSPSIPRAFRLSTRTPARR